MPDAELLTAEDVAQEAAALVSRLAEAAVAARGCFRVVLSGGSTPLAMYDLLKARALPWHATWLYWGDERFVPYSDPKSNYGAAKARLLDAALVPEHQVHPWPFVPDRPEVAAGAYAEVLRETAGEAPDFDLVLLGLGEDGHTASLFPGDDALAAEGLTAVVRPASQKTVRLTLTARALSQGRVVAFLVAGESKREALAATLYGERDPLRFPAQAISARERLLWISDQALG